MSDQLGRAALTIGGYAAFGPLGALAGGILGDLLFPVEAGEGPRLNELNVQQSTVGAPIPIVYGTVALAGNVIWSGGLTETEHEGESAGKGGPSGPSTYTYSVDVAIGICEGPIDGIRRIWGDADLLYDASDDATLEARLEGTGVDVAQTIAEIRAMSAQLTFELYLGTEDQLADPTIESYEGAGNVPGFRGLAYIVFPQFQLERFGNRIPNFRLEVYAGSPAECGIYSAGVLYPWEFEFDPATNDPRNPDNQHLYANCSGGMQVSDTTLQAAVAGLSSDFSGRTFLVDAALGKNYGDNIYIQGWSATTTPNNYRPCDAVVSLDDRVTLSLQLNSIHQTPADRYDCTGAGGAAQPAGGYCAEQLNYTVRSYYDGQTSGFYALTDDNDTATAVGLFEGVTVAQGLDSFGDCTPPEPVQKWRLMDQHICVTRSIQPPDTYLLTWTQVSGTFKALQPYDDTGDFGVVNTYPVGPVLAVGDINYNDQDYWEAAYAAALANGEPIASGLTYGVDYPVVTSTAFSSECTAVTVDCVPMATIVADICRRSGLRTDTSTQIDVSDLTTCVPGYVIGRQMSGRDALGPLRIYGLWDCVESGALLKFIERGHAIVASLSVDDLGVHEAGSQAPSLVEVSRIQEKDLPRRVRLHFANFLHDHESSEQSASRITTEAIDELDVELPISMEPDTAKQLAEISLYAQWVGRNTFRISLDNSRLALEPTDCIEIPVDGETERVRITAVDYSIGGILRVDAVRDDDGSYISTAVATPSQPSGGVPGAGGNGPICPSEVVLLDIPRLRDQDTDAGYYAAIYGLCDSWACAELYRSSDGGATYGRVARTDLQATVGEIVTITGPPTDVPVLGDSPQYDASSSITVTLFHGTLSSVTDEQIQAGQNSAAIGQHGHWVIIQYKTATLDTGDTWILTDLIWGLRDTTNNLGTIGDGDTFVWLNDPALLRIPETPANIGVEKQLKVVSCGQSIDDADVIDFTTWGLSYLRLCPSTVLSASLTEPPLSPANGDAYLLPNDTSLSGLWELHGGEIATWSDDTDNWVYCTPAPGTIVHISEGENSDGEGGEDVISGGDGTYTGPVWTPAIPPLLECGSGIDPLTAYFVVHTGAGYCKVTITDAVISSIDSSFTGGGGFPNATYLTEQDETTDLPNSLRLVAGTNITFDTDTSGNTLEISSGVGAGSGIPLNTQTGNYTLVLGDAGYCIYRDSGSAATWTIPANGSVAFPVGTVVMFNNQDADTNITIAITTDTLIYSPGGATGSRGLVPNGRAFAHKVSSTVWVLSGTGII